MSASQIALSAWGGRAFVSGVSFDFVYISDVLAVNLHLAAKCLYVQRVYAKIRVQIDGVEVSVSKV